MNISVRHLVALEASEHLILEGKVTLGILARNFGYSRSEVGAVCKVYSPLARSSASTVCIASVTSFFLSSTQVLTARYLDPEEFRLEVARVVTMPS